MGTLLWRKKIEVENLVQVYLKVLISGSWNDFLDNMQLLYQGRTQIDLVSLYK
jgi:hypothetical protein